MCDLWTWTSSAPILPFHLHKNSNINVKSSKLACLHKPATCHQLVNGDKNLLNDFAVVTKKHTCYTLYVMITCWKFFLLSHFVYIMQIPQFQSTHTYKDIEIIPFQTTQDLCFISNMKNGVWIQQSLKLKIRGGVWQKSHHRKHKKQDKVAKCCLKPWNSKLNHHQMLFTFFTPFLFPFYFIFLSLHSATQFRAFNRMKPGEFGPILPFIFQVCLLLYLNHNILRSHKKNLFLWNF